MDEVFEFIKKVSWTARILAVILVCGLVYIYICDDKLLCNIANGVVGSISILGVAVSIYIYEITKKLEKKLKYMDLMKMRNFIMNKATILQGLDGNLQRLEYDLSSPETFTNIKIDLTTKLSTLSSYKVIMDNSHNNILDKMIVDLDNLDFSNAEGIEKLRSNLAKMIGYLKSDFEAEIGLGGDEIAKG